MVYYATNLNEFIKTWKKIKEKIIVVTKGKEQRNTEWNKIELLTYLFFVVESEYTLSLNLPTLHLFSEAFC